MHVVKLFLFALALPLMAQEPHLTASIPCDPAKGCTDTPIPAKQNQSTIEQLQVQLKQVQQERDAYKDMLYKAQMRITALGGSLNGCIVATEQMSLPKETPKP